MHPEWVYDAVIYEVNTAVYTEGTFNALTEHLPRFQELGLISFGLCLYKQLVRRIVRVLSEAIIL